ncbi:Hypothetical predicted protein [Olea europaea subsp. europaea]|uniref:Uncharacterized protein n=1 Tax=Olea europaea subsp. europaea TaxID=158383 RepID=A0A8S0VNA4_OLEEU|nr:Hypothetical predicted protein [Olea europaea subsp. europaea]
MAGMRVQPDKIITELDQPDEARRVLDHPSIRTQPLSSKEKEKEKEPIRKEEKEEARSEEGGQSIFIHMFYLFDSKGREDEDTERTISSAPMGEGPPARTSAIEVPVQPSAQVATTTEIRQKTYI